MNQGLMPGRWKRRFFTASRSTVVSTQLTVQCFTVPSYETINHSGGPRKKKIMLDITNAVIMIEKRKVELSERDMEGNVDDALLFLKESSAAFVVEERRLQLKFQEFVTNEVDEAGRQLTCVSHISDTPEQNTFPVKTTEASIYPNIQYISPL
jgi:hypothetical protein